MREQSIFLAGLDIADPAQRSSFLSGACGNDAALCKHIEELIRSDRKLGGYFFQPHNNVDVTWGLTYVTEPHCLNIVSFNGPLAKR